MGEGDYIMRLLTVGQKIFIIDENIIRAFPNLTGE